MSGESNIVTGLDNVLMPMLRPLPIKTKGEGFFTRMWRWVLSRRKFEVTEDYYFYVPWMDQTLFIPKGFIFDGASVPKLLWPILSPTGILFIASLFHDFGYRYNMYLNAQGEPVCSDNGKIFFDNQFGKMNVYINGIFSLSWTAAKTLVVFAWIPWWTARRRDKQLHIDFPHLFSEPLKCEQ